MTVNYEAIPQIVGDLTKKWDSIIITGEVFRAKVHPKQLKDIDKAYDISIKLTPESFKTLKQLRLHSVDAKGNIIEENVRPLTGLKKVELKKKDENGNDVLDEMGDPVKEFSHYQITVRQNKVIRQNGVETPVVIPVTMAADGSAVTNFLNEGSTVSVQAQAYDTVYRDQPHSGLNLKEIKCFSPVFYEGGNGGSGGSNDPWAAIGLTAADVPSFDVPDATAPAEAPQQGMPANASPELDDKFSDEKIPF